MIAPHRKPQRSRFATRSLSIVICAIGLPASTDRARRVRISRSGSNTSGA